MNDVKRSGRKSVFMNMCDIWGVKIAVEKCEEFGIPVSTMELMEVQDREKQKKEDIAAVIRQLRESEGRCTDD